ncbi:MAG: hypothetical protein JSS89_03420 [Bacteroidetes bacterium]|nr:hypothetical protein [Bacteroidota bacterium]
MRHTSTTIVALFVLALTNITAQDLQTRHLVMLNGTATTRLQAPSSGGPFTFSLPSTPTSGSLMVNPTPLLSTHPMLYGVTSAQNAETSSSHFLFNVAYDPTTTGSTPGAMISSAGTGPGTATGLTVSATGGAMNYALLIPSGGGNVGIGTSTPGSLLTVGTVFTVDAAGPVTVQGGGELRLNRADNTVYNAFTTDATQATNITYVMPKTMGSVGQYLRIASIAGSTASLEWVTPPAALGQGGSFGTVILPALVTISSDACSDVTGLNFTANANTVYWVTVTFEIAKNNGGTSPTVNTCFSIPAGAVWSFNTTANVSGYGTGDVLLYTGLTASHQFVQVTGFLSVGATGGTFQVRLRKTIAGDADVDVIVDGTHIDYL